MSSILQDFTNSYIANYCYCEILCLLIIDNGWYFETGCRRLPGSHLTRTSSPLKLIYIYKLVIPNSNFVVFERYLHTGRGGELENKQHYMRMNIHFSSFTFDLVRHFLFVRYVHVVTKPSIVLIESMVIHPSM